MQYPTVTVIIATYNSEKTIHKCLQSVQDQNYPQNKIDIILADGGSVDSTLSIVKNFNTRVIHVPPKAQNAEYNKGIGVAQAKGDLLLMIDHDNVLPHTEWLKKMVRPLQENKDIVGVETLRYHYDPRQSLLDRYFSLFGAGDPVAFYLGKVDRLSYIYDAYNLCGNAVDKGSYYIVRFKPDKISTLGANGFIVRRKILVENAKVDPDLFFHIDVIVDLIRKGFNTYAFIKDDIIHLTGYKSITNFLFRRKLFMEQFYIKTYNDRRYSVYEPKDKIRLILFILYAITFVKPTFDAFRGYIKIHDIAWFLHPFLCFALFTIYSSVIIKNTIQKL